MSSTVAPYRNLRTVKGAGIFSIVAGAILIVAGILVWILVSTSLADEKITVAEDASMFAGQSVTGPFTAYAQADIINHHALEASEGKTYAELDREDPVRETMMNASFLRASLFTSVVAFGICALVIGLGVVFLVLGFALNRLATPETIASPAP